MSKEAVKVVVRSRPLNSREKADKRQIIVSLDMAIGTINIENPHDPSQEPKSFTFDSVYDENTAQKFVYDGKQHIDSKCSKLTVRNDRYCISVG